MQHYPPPRSDHHYCSSIGRHGVANSVVQIVMKIVFDNAIEKKLVKNPVGKMCQEKDSIVYNLVV